MTTIILSLLAKFWPVIAGGALALGGVVFGWGKGKAADAKNAQAAATVAAAKQQTADAANAEAQANADAAQAGAQAVKARTDVDNAVAAKPADEVRNELQNWTRD